MFGEGSFKDPIAFLKWSYIRDIGYQLESGCVANNKQGGAADLFGILRYNIS